MAVLTVFSARPGYHGGMDVIYVDEIFLLNGLIDYLLLLLSAKLTGVPLRRGRFLLAAALGGVYAVAAALPPAGVLRTPWVKLAVSLAMAWAAFGGGRQIWRGWLGFLVLSAGFAGTVFAAAALSGEGTGGGSYAGVSWRVLLLAFGVCYAAVRFFLSRLSRERDRGPLKVEIRLGERAAALAALRDTGNRLADPISGRGVLIAGADALAPLLNRPLPKPVPEDAATVFRLLSEDPVLRPRLRLVPYAALGRQEGLLTCFRPDAVTVEGVPRDLLVAVSPTPIAGGYDALI